MSFHKWTVIGLGEKPTWRCKVQVRCQCGKISFVLPSPLISGKSKDCGCGKNQRLAERRRSHGMSKTPEFRAWRAMKARCSNAKNASYLRYGGRGIKVCPRWEASFEEFFRDMGKKPSPEFSIHRLDNDKGYSPDNCVWASIETQNNWKSQNVYLEFNGQKLTQAQWGRKLRIPRWTISRRLGSGYPVEQVLKPGRLSGWKQKTCNRGPRGPYKKSNKIITT